MAPPRVKLRVWTACLALVACSAWAQQTRQESGQQNLVSVQAEVSREVDNDELVAVLAAEAQGTDPAALALAINRRMASALELARGFPAVKLRSGNYQTYPRYREQRVEGWHAAQELRLESSDFTAAARLIGALQKDLVVRSMSVRLSHEARRAAENALIPEAIAAFQARADIARKALKANGYRLRNVSVETAAPGPPVPFASMTRAQSATAPPAVEPGASQVVVTVSGTVQLE
jgi:predicted secreted protein